MCALHCTRVRRARTRWRIRGARPRVRRVAQCFFQGGRARTHRADTIPRGFSGEQSYWTIVGVDGGGESGLLSEDGALEVARGGFSIEPFVVADSRIFTWADVETTQSLRRRLPADPERDMASAAMDAAGDGVCRGRSRAITDCRATTSCATSTRSTAARSTLALAVRPFQVNPPAQFLNTPAVSRPIHAHRVEWQGADRERRRARLPAACAGAASARSHFDAGHSSSCSRITDWRRPRTSVARSRSATRRGARLSADARARASTTVAVVVTALRRGARRACRRSRRRRVDRARAGPRRRAWRAQLDRRRRSRARRGATVRRHAAHARSRTS